MLFRSGLRLTTARYYTPSGRSIQLSGIVPDIEMKYIPYDEKKEKQRPHILREKDLKGHMLNETTKKDDTETTKNHYDKDERVKMILEKDNQVRHALQLLQTWNIFSKIQSHP